MYESNNSFSDRYFLPQRACSGSQAQVNATILPTNDVDWYVYRSVDSGCGGAWPQLTVYLDNLPADYDIDVFFRCASDLSPPTYNCQFGSWSCTLTESGIDFYGCCSNNGGTIREDIRTTFDCAGTATDDVWVYFRVTPYSSAVSCDPYRIYYITQ